ncbi:MAG: aminotransferase class I/II-fold pyridoxal phosphate-dependent enzyme, partial [Candidatus Latescibacteria bacterium]|nr:aminotransferase class I/II-fold pyridoxal phosphate-dependent enzyme [Candidatus Latescibacterota bacterium]
AGPAQIELVTIDWLRKICGLPETAGGLFVSGGSVANITALAVARQKCLGDDFRNGMVYMSDQTHSSVRRGLRLLGFAPDQLVIIPSDDDYRIPLDDLANRVETDRATDRTPFCIVANAGTTNTGSIDPLPELADLCSHEGLWLHADGAFGAAAALCPRGKKLLAGLDRVDSLSLDPHKWLFQPFECGVVLVRDREHLRETFHVLPEYLRDLEGESEEVNFYDYGIQLTRGFRALKLWMSIQVFGLGAFRAAIERGIALAEHAEAILRDRSHWEVVSSACMGVITFRCIPSDGRDVDGYNRSLVQPLLEDGFALVMTTEIKGRTVLRFCTINPRTTEEDILQTIERLEYFANQTRLL